ncbi:hypothetical protein HOD08_01865 [bacterium]|jgi:hypothetical protein|nr:hypothetical protein [bacterium]
MNIFVKLSLCALHVLLLDSTAAAFEKSVSDMRSVELSAVTRKLFRQVKSPIQSEVVTDPLVLQEAVWDALRYFKHKKNLVQSPLLGRVGLSAAQVERTLKFIHETIEADKESGNFRVLDQSFLNKNFNFVSWDGDRHGLKRDGIVIPERPDGGRLDPGKIRLTNYAVFSVDGSPHRTKIYDAALYEADTKDEELQGAMAKMTWDDLWGGRAFRRKSLSRVVKPLIWLSRHDAEDAAMQGTTVVRMPDGARRVFNVHRSLEILGSEQSRPGLRSPKYWFFREINDIDGRDGGPQLKIVKHGGAVFAGNIKDLGLGKIIAIGYKNPTSRKEEIRLGVLSDTGGAFKDNLYQLDLYAGIFEDRKSFRKHLWRFPNTVNAYFLVRKHGSRSLPGALVPGTQAIRDHEV